jgi:SSS family solute:Na+ symporter
MIIFTYFGGMEAVIWVEVVQLGIYIAGAIAAAVVLINSIDGGFANRKLACDSVWQVFTLRLQLSMSHEDLHVLVGIDRWLFPDDEHARHGPVSGAALSLHRSSAQSNDCFADERRDRSGPVHRISFHRRVAVCVLSSVHRSGLCAAASTAFPFTGGDRVFPDFITKYMPTGLSGLVVAAIFAAAMSSSLNSIAATAVNDLYKPFRPNREDKHYLKVSHVLTLIWGVVQIGVALPSKSTRLGVEHGALDRVVDQWSNSRCVSGRDISAARQPAAGVDRHARKHRIDALRVFATKIAWTWYVFLGSLITFVVAWAASFAFAPATKEMGR